ncbi:amino acid ABC transporter permease [Leucobacter sp. UCMA 4100]|uniref:amino acid ABC transporter permease n=1 Tax=Leucobacter sp. UCMA 4100 TaxID=2810534 RepID=UPI0022EA4191|nr:amino acid ABC transporter permease [Leucobacter sp. UCMA 4100]MDA3146869.1 amino acid ABC transporter permease [Leucobacter sp. UCMA 4100]
MIAETSSPRRSEPFANAGSITGPINAVPVRKPGQIIAGTIIAVVVGWLVFTVATNPNFNWGIVAKNLTAPSILRGLTTTITLTVLAMLIGIVLGMLLAVARLSKNSVLRGVSLAYIWLFRGTPLLVQLLLWFNLALFFPRIGFGDFSVDTNALITAFVAALLGLGLNEGAYMAEIMRSGIQAVDAGQAEAASALGMRRSLVMRRIILPQAMRVIIPPTGNNLITMLKMTSLVTVIAAPDLLNRAQAISAKNFYVFELLIVASVWYMLLTTIFTLVQMQLERRFAKGTVATGAKMRKRIVKNLAPGRVTNTELIEAIGERRTP